MNKTHRLNSFMFSRGKARRALGIASVFILGTLLFLTLSPVTYAQPAPMPQPVQITAADGLTLSAGYYQPMIESVQLQPAVLLLHMIGADRQSWSPLIPALLDSDYAVLVPDLRGHGESGGEINWTAATTDVQTWLDWLRTQPGVHPDSMSVIGASIGANLALIGCANDPGCVTTIALSPGVDYYGLEPRRSIVGNLSTRSTLLIASQIDTYSADSVKELMSSATGDIGVRLFSPNGHGTNLFLNDEIAAPLTELIIDWLNEPLHLTINSYRRT